MLIFDQAIPALLYKSWTFSCSNGIKSVLINPHMAIKRKKERNHQAALGLHLPSYFALLWSRGVRLLRGNTTPSVPRPPDPGSQRLATHPPWPQRPQRAIRRDRSHHASVLGPKVDQRQEGRCVATSTLLLRGDPTALSVPPRLGR